MEIILTKLLKNLNRVEMKHIALFWVWENFYMKKTYGLLNNHFPSIHKNQDSIKSMKTN